MYVVFWSFEIVGRYIDINLRQVGHSFIFAEVSLCLLPIDVIRNTSATSSLESLRQANIGSDAVASACLLSVMPPKLTPSSVYCKIRPLATSGGHADTLVERFDIEQFSDFSAK